MPHKENHAFLGKQTVADQTLEQHYQAILVIVNQLERLSRDETTKEYRKFHRAFPGRHTLPRPSRLPIGEGQYVSEYQDVALTPVNFSIIRSDEGQFFALDNHWLRDEVKKDKPSGATADFKGMREICVTHSGDDITALSWGASSGPTMRGAKIFKSISDSENCQAEQHAQQVLGREVRFFSVKRGAIIQRGSRNKEGYKNILMMPWYQGRDLSSYMDPDDDAKRLTLNAYIGALYDVANQLCQLHRANVLHGDVKAENIMLYWDDIKERYRGYLIDTGYSQENGYKGKILSGSHYYLPEEHFTPKMDNSHEKYVFQKNGEACWFNPQRDGDGLIHHTQRLDEYALGQVLEDTDFAIDFNEATDTDSLTGLVAQAKRLKSSETTVEAVKVFLRDLYQGANLSDEADESGVTADPAVSLSP